MKINWTFMAGGWFMYGLSGVLDFFWPTQTNVGGLVYSATLLILGAVIFYRRSRSGA